jgi:hypothetical protein
MENILEHAEPPAKNLSRPHISEQLQARNENRKDENDMPSGIMNSSSSDKTE